MSEKQQAMAFRMQSCVEELQETICDALEERDGEATFTRDRWKRDEGGGGLTRVMEEGAVFEKAGVNTSAVHGQLPRTMAHALGVAEAPFYATGISLIIHARNPFVPTVHANFRYFALGEDLEQPDDEWFGGGADLTPVYPFLEDAQHFHRTWKQVCDRHPSVADYAAFKRQCDDYFYLPHRGEARGVGGIFYDYVREEAEAAYAFSRDAGSQFLQAYMPLVDRREDMPYGDREKRFQQLRRGRYVEFNLVYDRGTRFGLETGGRTESILVSLPPEVVWRYDWAPEEGSREQQAAWYFLGRDWLSLSPADTPGSGRVSNSDANMDAGGDDRVGTIEREPGE